MKNLYKITCTTPYAGTDQEYWVLANSKEDIYEGDLEIWAHDNAEAYEYLAIGWGDDWESEEDRDDYYTDCSYDISEPFTLEDAIDEGYSGIPDEEY